MRIRNRSLVLAAAATSLTLALTACGQDSEGGSKEKKGDKEGGTIGIAMPTKSSERWIADGANMVEQFEMLGYDTDLQYGNDQVENQVAQVENMITKGVDVLVIAAIDGSAMTPVLQQAADADIPVISYDRLLLGSEHVDYYASFDNFQVGVLQGTYIEEQLKLKEGEGPFNIELFAGSPDDNNTQYFFNGAMSVLKPYLDDKKLVVRSGQTKLNQITTLRWEAGRAQSRMDDLLTSAYSSQTLDAVLSPYDGMSIGILSALRSAGYDSKNMPVITGQDAEVNSIKSILSGEQTQTVFKDTRKLAKAAVQMADAVLNDKEPEVNDTEQYDNGKKVVPAFLLEPVSVDKSNAQKEVIDSGYIDASKIN